MSATTGTTNTNTSGETNVAHDIKKKTGSDCLDDKTMEEIARRLVSFVESDEVGDVVFSPEPPNSKTKIWIETDATGSIIGTVKRFDSSTGQWVDDHFDPSVEPLKLFIKVDTIGSDDQVIQYNHNFETGEYIYTIVYKGEPTVDARWFQASADNDDLEIHYLDLSGVEVEIRILEYDNET